ncbi:sigma-54-dependent Fis family transcriptional regulator [Lysobacter pythonis]|uniref:Sigma-54-dependent Fis family transcriptional regulator n=1 Tax=Solilutibacter pythonis TaxID=2483112 RepID=A0A3M2I331_9GAMM|nr:sigma-54 dependent transcriptional regulator [Lysobacter pythonis]RMH92907.1 sigma-54-dependent Fis family transcriptional regulator [Lysobacter pythonis]
MPTVLVIDDNPSVATALELLFSLHGIDTVAAASPGEGLARLERGDIDLVIADMNFEADTTSGDEGVVLFNDIRATWPDMPVILLTAWTQLERAVELVKAGAADYLGKPWDDSKLLTSVRNLLELSEVQRTLSANTRQTRKRREALADRHDLRGVVYADDASERVLALACQIAASPLPVLVTGPNGSGKEKIAEILHANSQVARGPFVALNCGALPAELIEAELFGAEAGAYTGANRAREGKFEAADGGTLFLDEIGTLPPAGQAKLLRVLETGRFSRLGSNREKTATVRVVSATNADLPAMIERGEFREDLFYRLNAIELRLPPLAERREDILPLARHFLGDDKRLSPEAERTLLTHTWPGNVRELRNVVQRAALLSRHEWIEAEALGLQPGETRESAHHEPTTAEIEGALRRHRGIIAQAAAELGLSRQALYRRMDRLGIGRE